MPTNSPNITFLNRAMNPPKVPMNIATATVFTDKGINNTSQKEEKKPLLTCFFPKSFCNLPVNCIFVYNFGVVMTDEDKKLLSTFEARLRHLIYLHDELKRENAELKQLLKAKEEECAKAHADYQELERNYANLKNATTISLNGSDVKETKLRLSKLVREVDKCIALLNE